MLVCNKLTKEEKRYCSELYSKYRRFMYSVAMQYASYEMPAEDIVQNASYVMAKYSYRFRDMDEPACLTYLRLIVQSVANDHYRHVKRDERLLFQVEALSICSARSAEEDYMDFADSELIEEVLDSLDDRASTLLRGKYYLHLSDEEIADIVGCKPDSVRTLVRRAKQKAEKKLIKEGFKHDEI